MNRAAGGAPPEPGNARPQLNTSLFERVGRHGYRYPSPIANSVQSRPDFKEPPFFPNAKVTSMLERGWVRFTGKLLPEKGLLKINDGYEYDVRVLQPSPDISGNYIFQTEEGVMHVPAKGKYVDWDFYIKTEPVPFVPRPAFPTGGAGSSGASFTGGKRKKSKKTCKHKVSKKNCRKSRHSRK
jgi:hypothetical protein